MKAGQYIVQTLRRLATALLRAIIGTILWAGVSVIGIAGEVICGVFRIVLGVFVTLVSIIAFFGFIVWLLTI